MKRITTVVVAAVAALVLAGCSASAEPDEGKYLALMSEAGYPSDAVDPDTMLESGHEICAKAKDSDQTPTEYAAGVASFMNDEGAAKWYRTMGEAASVALCP